MSAHGCAAERAVGFLLKPLEQTLFVENMTTLKAAHDTSSCQAYGTFGRRIFDPPYLQQILKEGGGPKPEEGKTLPTNHIDIYLKPLGLNHNSLYIHFYFLPTPL